MTFDSSPHAPAAEVAPTRLRHTAERLIGRDKEIAQLDAAWNDPSKNVVVVRAFGGMGKTSLVATWRATLEASQGRRGAERIFDWTFYSQGTSDQRNASSDAFISAALRFFGDSDPTLVSPWDRGARLAHVVGSVRSLLILDGIEPLQYPPGPTESKLRDFGLEALLKGLAARNLGLCIVTSRERVTDIQQYYGRTAEDIELLELSDPAGAALLHYHGARRAGASEIPPDDHELQEASREVRGHGLTLQLLGQYLRLAEGGDIRKRDTVRLADADREYQNDASRPYGHAFKAMEAYERWFQREGESGQRQLAVLRLLGLFDRPASKGCLAALRKKPVIPGLTEPLVDLSRRGWDTILGRLGDIGLVARQRDAPLDAHPLLREYFAHRLRETWPDACKEGHRRLYQHLCETTNEGKEPTLEDLQPLYQAVAHGCQAELQQEACDKVYCKRIGRGNEFYSTNKLGAFGSDLGAVACFFETPWSRVSPALTEGAQAWLLNEAATRLRALGRLTAALEPMRINLRMRADREEWQHASSSASNLSELELTLGEVAWAARDAEQSVTYADRSGDAFERMLFRTTYADALHQVGQRTEAEALFREAEQMQAKNQPQYPLLYSVQGFQYCDLLLAEAEQEAGKVEAGANGQRFLAVCRAVSGRAVQTLKWATDAKADLLSIPLDHLTLGRAALYAAILESRGHPPLASPEPEADRRAFKRAATELDLAVSGLRLASTQHHLPPALLSRAWQRAITGPRTGADSTQTDLDGAWEIAERGPMPLFQADIHLYRARLFFREANYPWQSPRHDLEEAKRLIKDHKYGRRKQELEDAEAAILAPAAAGGTDPRLAPTATPAVPPAPAKTGDAPMDERATIVLLTVNDREASAVLDAFVGSGRAPAHKTIGGVTYNLLGSHGGMSIVHTIAEMGAGGVGASQQRAREAIEHWTPRAVIAVGIAFGMDETKQKIGDVLVSTQIQDYELGRLGSDGTVIPRGAKPDASHVLRNRLRQTDLTLVRERNDWPRVQFGLVLCGQKLVDNLDYRESLKKLGPEAIGGEMEATGVYVSAAAAKVDWIVVKAICDWGHDKNRAEKDAWQTLAARNAVLVLKAAIDFGSLFPDDESGVAPGGTGKRQPTPSAPPSPATSAAIPSPAAAEWKEKLALLQVEEARAVDPAMKFKIRKDIEEARAKIREHGGEP